MSHAVGNHSEQQETFRDRVESLAHTRSMDCYQCGKCSAGCPVAERMDVLPNRLVQMVQQNEEKDATSCGAIWLCLSCQTCTERCPKEVDPASIIDSLRQFALRENRVPADRQRILAFQQAFLASVRKYGRLAEFSLTLDFKARGYFATPLDLPFLMENALLAPKMISRGKLHFLPRGVKDKGVVRRIFDRCMPGETFE